MYWEYFGDLQQIVNGNELVCVFVEQVLYFFWFSCVGVMWGVLCFVLVLLCMFNLDCFDDVVLEWQVLVNLFVGFIILDVSVDGDEGDVVGDLIIGEDVDGMVIGGLEFGMLQELLLGWKIDFVNLFSVGFDYVEFLCGYLLVICVSQDVFYEVFIGDLCNVFDCVLCLIFNEFCCVIEQDQWFYMIFMFCQKVCDVFID